MNENACTQELSAVHAVRRVVTRREATRQRLAPPAPTRRRLDRCRHCGGVAIPGDDVCHGCG